MLSFYNCCFSAFKVTNNINLLLFRSAVHRSAQKLKMLNMVRKLHSPKRKRKGREGTEIPGYGRILQFSGEKNYFYFAQFAVWKQKFLISAAVIIQFEYMT